MKTFAEIEDYLLNLEDVWSDQPFGDKIIAYKIGKKTPEDKIFALIEKDSKPLLIDLKCDQILAEKMRETYETILPSKYMNRKLWNTILCTNQVPDDELKSLIMISYNLVKSES